jgi:hypothetical protein
MRMCVLLAGAGKVADTPADDGFPPDPVAGVLGPQVGQLCIRPAFLLIHVGVNFKSRREIRSADHRA